LFCAKVLK